MSTVTETWWQANDRMRVEQNYPPLHDPKTGARIDRGPLVYRGSEVLGSADPAGAAEPSTWEALDAAEFETWEAEPVRFIVEGLFPEQGLLWIGGRAKRGKSLFLLYTCLAIAAEHEMLCERFKISASPRILYIAREDSKGRIKERIADIVSAWPRKPDPRTYTIVVRPKGFNIASPEHMAWVRAQVAEYGYEMVVFDTWTALSPGADPLGAKEQTVLAQAMASLTEDIEALVVSVDHSRKNRPEGTVLGSADILGPSQKWQAAEAIIMLSDVKGNDHRLEVFVESKDADTERFYLDVSPRGSKREKFAYAGSVEAMAEASVGRKGSRQEQAWRLVEEGHGPQGAQTIAAKLGVSKDTAARYLKGGVTAGRLVAVDGKAVDGQPMAAWEPAQKDTPF